MSLLVTIDDFTEFRSIRDYPPENVAPEVLATVRNLDEREELEPFIRAILFDTGDTPHGPAELVDILTHKVRVRKETGLAAFILKGKSFKTVKPADVSHQIYRLEKVAGLFVAVFAATGAILDAAKEQFCSTAERLGCLHAVFDAMDIARLLLAFGFICPRDGQRIAAGRCKCGYSPKNRILNVLQEDALKALNETHLRGKKAGVVVLPPGSGKTRIAAEDALRVGVKRLLYVAHTHEILDVAVSEFEAVFGNDKVSRCADTNNIMKPNVISIATVQFLARHLEEVQTVPFDYLVIDEFHHAAAPTYRQLIAKSSPSFLLGLTATPFRSDQQDILELCDGNLIVARDLRMAIETGILCPYHYFGCFDDIDYSRIRFVHGSYDVRDLERYLIIPERHRAAMDEWRQRAEDKATIAFCCSHVHASAVADSFNSQGVPAALYLSTTTAEERKVVTEQFKDGEIKILCAVDVLNEGADFPFVECLLLLRPTESKRIFFQQLGRGLRRYVGKSHCTVIDFIGNFRNAFRVIEYQGLQPFDEGEVFSALTKFRTVKETLNLPIGCEVHFESRVIDVFADQALSYRNMNRHNISQGLIWQYLRLARRMRRKPSRGDVDRNLVLPSDFYRDVFGGWDVFEQKMQEEYAELLYTDEFVIERQVL